MTTDHDELTRALTQQAASVHLRGSSFDDVRGRARRIRRTRQTVVGAAAAVVVAIAVPAALNLSSPDALNQDPAVRTTQPAPSVSVSVSPTATPSSTPAPTLSLISSLDLPRGADPSVAWFDGRRWLDGAGDPIPLPDGTFDAVTAIGSRWYAETVDDGGNRTAVVVDAAGSETASHPLGSGPVVSVDESVIAWSDPDGKIYLDWDGAPEPLLDTSAEGTQVVAVEGTAPCASAADCVVTTKNPEDTGFDVDVLGDLKATVVVNDARGTFCTGVFDRAGGQAEELWRTCDLKLIGFSPDGATMLAAPVEGDGLGDGTLFMVDAQTGEVITSWKRSTDNGPTFAKTVWENPTHVLAETFEKGSWTIVRLGLDGSAEAASDTLVGEDVDPPLHLTQRP